MGIHEAAKRCCHRLGLLAAVHRVRNRHTLTVVMFHRVRPAASMAGADPDYTVGDALFGQCLSFFRRHYTLVGIDEVLAAQEGKARLPPCSLLITFDDGWDDNLEFAVPRLAAEVMPALLFASAGAVFDEQDPWWQEVLLAALRHGRAGYDRLWHAVPGDAAPEGSQSILDLLVRYGACSAETRAQALAPFDDGGPVRHMLTPARLLALAAAGISIGSHGSAHLPLTMMADPKADMEDSRRRLCALLAGRFSAVFSFPHGRYSPALISAAFAAGFRLLFTSDPVLNLVIAGRPAAILGRIEIPAEQICGQDGGLRHHRLATWLFLRRRRHLGSLNGLTGAQGHD